MIFYQPCTVPQAIKTTRKTSLWIKSISNYYYHKSRQSYYKLRHKFAYYKLRQSVVTNYDSFFIKNYDKVLTNCDRYFKLRQLLQTTTIYYKLRQNTCYKCTDHKETKASLITYKINIKVKHKLLLSVYKKREQRQYAK